MNVTMNIYPQRILVEVGRFSIDHLNGHNSQRPEINFRAVLFAGDHFGGHPVRSADHCRSLRLLRADLRTETEIRCSTKIESR